MSTEDDRRIARGAAALMAFALDLPPEVFFRATRGAPAEAAARQLWMAVIRRATADRMSVARISVAIGRDRSSVSHALHAVESACEEDPDLDAFLDHYARLVRDLIAISAFTVAELDARSAAPRPPAGRAVQT